MPEFVVRTYQYCWSPSLRRMPCICFCSCSVRSTFRSTLRLTGALLGPLAVLAVCAGVFTFLMSLVLRVMSEPGMANGFQTFAICMIALAIVCWVLVLLLGAAVKQADKEAAEKKRREDEAQRDADEQSRLKRTLEDINTRSIDLSDRLPGHLLDAAQNIRQATVDFTERAYSPYWQSVENAANALARFDEGVNHIARNAESYRETAMDYRGALEPFAVSSVSVDQLEIADDVAQKMGEVVREAQRDYEFASIFEQRKTNQLLVEGFRNLGDAISRMSSEIRSSIRQLDSSVNSLNNRLDKGLSDAADTSERVHSQLVRSSSAQAGREKAMVRELDAVRRELKYGFR